MSEPAERSYEIKRRDLLSRLQRLARPDNPADLGWKMARRLYLADRTGGDGRISIHQVGPFDDDSFAQAYMERPSGGDGDLISFVLLYGRRGR